jgi:hypothetical protein
LSTELELRDILECSDDEVDKPIRREDIGEHDGAIAEDTTDPLEDEEEEEEEDEEDEEEEDEDDEEDDEDDEEEVL